MNEPTLLKIATDTVALFGRNIVMRILSYSTAFLTARVLGPEMFGLLGIINQVPSLAKFGSFGYDGVAVREISHISQTTQTERIKSLRNVTFTADMIWSLLLSFSVFAASYLFERQEIYWGLKIASLSLFASQIIRLYVANVRLDKNFQLLSVVQSVAHVINTILVVGTIFFIGMYSVLMAGLATSVLLICIYQKTVGLRFTFEYDRHELWRLTKIATPISIATVLYGLWAWSERILVLWFFGLETLGIYSLAIAGVQAGLMLSTSVLEAFVIHVFQTLGDTRGQVKDIAAKKLLHVSTISISYGCPIVGASIIFIGPAMVNSFLPEYTDIIRFLPWVAGILWIQGLPLTYRASLTSARIDKQWLNTVQGGVSLVLFVALAYLIHIFESTLIAPLAAKLIAYTVLAFWGLYTAGSYLYEDISECLGLLFQYLVPLFWSVPCIFIASQIGGVNWLGGILSFCCFMILYLPIVIWQCLKVDLIRLGPGLVISFPWNRNINNT